MRDENIKQDNFCNAKHSFSSLGLLFQPCAAFLDQLCLSWLYLLGWYLGKKNKTKQLGSEDLFLGEIKHILDAKKFFFVGVNSWHKNVFFWHTNLFCRKQNLVWEQNIEEREKMGGDIFLEGPKKNNLSLGAIYSEGKKNYFGRGKQIFVNGKKKKNSRKLNPFLVKKTIFSVA